MNMFSKKAKNKIQSILVSLNEIINSKKGKSILDVIENSDKIVELCKNIIKKNIPFEYKSTWRLTAIKKMNCVAEETKEKIISNFEKKNIYIITKYLVIFLSCFQF